MNYQALLLYLKDFRINGSDRGISQLINIALQFLEDSEIYCRIGKLDQKSDLITELLTHTDKLSYIILPEVSPTPLEEGSESSNDGFDIFQDEHLVEALVNHNLDEQVYLFQQGFEEFFQALQQDQPDLKIGVYLYKGADDYRSCLMSLLLAKNVLADRALIIINKLSHSMVQLAVRDFVTTHHQCKILWEIFPTPGSLDSLGYYLLSWDNECEIVDYMPELDVLRSQPAIEAIAALSEHFETEMKLSQLPELKKQALDFYFGRQYQEAIEKYKVALQWQPYDADLCHNFAMAYYDTGKMEEALALIYRAIRINPEVATFLYSLGLIWEKIGDKQQAIPAYQKALEIDPDHLKSCNNLANIYYTLEQADLALKLYHRIVGINPEFYGAYLNIGNILVTQEKFEEAIEIYKKALKLKSEDPDILYNLGFAYLAKGDEVNGFSNRALSAFYKKDYQEAAHYFNQCLQVSQEKPLVYVFLAKSYKFLEQYDLAIATLEQGIKLHPHEEGIYYVSGLIFQDACLNQELMDLKAKAAKIFNQSIRIKLQFLRFLPLIYDSKEEIGVYWHNFMKSLSEVESLINSSEALRQVYAISSNINMFYTFYQGKCVRDTQQRVGTILHEAMNQVHPEWTQLQKLPPLTEQNKIKIGYISSCMCKHVVGLLTSGWLKYHDPENFEIYSYYVGDTVDTTTQKYQLYSDRFYHIRQFDQICKQVISDQLHILVFLDMGMMPMLMKLGSLRLAPIQCKFWGPPVTSGLPTIDYFLTSDLMEPDNGAEHYTETLIRLPNIAASYAKPSFTKFKKNRSDFGLGEDRIVYFCGQAPEKYLPQYDYIFPTIAQQVVNAQFIFVGRRNHLLSKKFSARVGGAFLEAGLNFEDYCLVTPFLKGNDFPNLNAICDISLDTLEWSGGKTALDSLACGVPVVTCPGEFMRGRHSYGILRMLGVTDTIASSEAEYIQIAVRLGLDSDWRQEIVEKIKQNSDRLFDDLECVRGLEAFYKKVVYEKLGLQS